jgi:hypothetical protein
MPSLVKWIRHLETKIADQERYAKPWEARYRNEWVLPFLLAEYREVYGARSEGLLMQLEPPRTGTAAVGVDALVERLTVIGVEASGTVDKDALRKLNEAWEDSDLDVMHREAHRETLIKARSFGVVDVAADGRRAVAGIEPAEQMAVHRLAAPPYDIDAAMKVWADEWTGKRAGRLWVGDVVHDLVEGETTDEEGVTVRWSIGEPQRLPFGRPPVVEFAQRPRLIADPVSDIDRIASLADIVDLVEGLMVFAGHFGAVPIRYATGLPIPRDPSDASGQTPLLDSSGSPSMGFNPRADHMWTSTEPDTKFGQLEPAGLASFVSWAEHATSRVRAITSVPASYYGVNLQTHINAEALKTDEAPMVRRVLGMGRDGAFGQSWRRLLTFVQMVEAHETLSSMRVRARWVDPETRVEAQATDSFQKLVASGLGVRAAAEKVLGWDPELVERAVQEKTVEDERIALLAEGLNAQSGAGGGSTGLVAVS